MMQIYNISLKPPNFYTLFCYLEITFHTVVAHTGLFLTIPKKKVRNIENLKVSRDCDSPKPHVVEAQITPPDSPYYPKQLI